MLCISFLNSFALPLPMGLVDLARLSSDVENLERDRASNFFYRLISDLLKPLNFLKNREWFEAHPIEGEPVTFGSKEELNNITGSQLFIGYSRRQLFENAESFLVASTHYNDRFHFDMGVYFHNSLMSNSFFGLDNKVISRSALESIFYEKKSDHDSLAFAFDNDLLVQDGTVSGSKVYLLHPKYLLKAINKPEEQQPNKRT
jgi:hypothetical protein